MTTSKRDASKAGYLLHGKKAQVRSVAASDLAQARRRVSQASKTALQDASETYRKALKRLADR